MTLHIFNPDHDLALASGIENFTAPHAGRQLRHDLGWLPALWADEDGCILVDDVPAAERGARHRPVRCRNFVSYQQLASLDVTRIEPWGWNAALCAKLRRHGLKTKDDRLKTKEELETIRQLSHRRTAAQLLPLLQADGTVGEATECTTTEEVFALIGRYGDTVLKAPWSSSGRGVRFLSPLTSHLSPLPSYLSPLTSHLSPLTSHLSPLPSPPSTQNIDGWLRNTLQRQGSVMVEPQYTKVKDFGMEFHSDGEGHVSYLGLSLFHTSNGAYTGNIIATEQAKREALSRYIPISLLDDTQQRICQILGHLFEGKYRGPFGIDMMVVRAPSCLPQPGEVGCASKAPSCLSEEVGRALKASPSWGRLEGAFHPCVEINLRRTMGHVALALSTICNPTSDDEVQHVMRINYLNNNYKLQIRRQ